MADNTQLRGAADRRRINVNESYELRYWSKKFGCSEEELKRVVGEVGDNADKVAERFQQKN